MYIYLQLSRDSTRSDLSIYIYPRGNERSSRGFIKFRVLKKLQATGSTGGIVTIWNRFPTRAIRKTRNTIRNSFILILIL